MAGETAVAVPEIVQDEDAVDRLLRLLVGAKAVRILEIRNRLTDLPYFGRSISFVGYPDDQRACLAKVLTEALGKPVEVKFIGRAKGMLRMYEKVDNDDPAGGTRLSLEEAFGIKLEKAALDAACVLSKLVRKNAIEIPEVCERLFCMLRQFFPIARVVGLEGQEMWLWISID